MRPLHLLLTLACFSSACSGDGLTEPKSELTAEVVAGSWTFTLSNEAGTCSGAAGGGDITIRLSGTSADVIGGSVLNFTTDSWGTPTDTFGQITGHIDLTTGDIELRVWKGVLENGALLTGTVTKSLTFSGTLMDPIPGFDPIFVFGSCTFDVTGSHD